MRRGWLLLPLIAACSGTETMITTEGRREATTTVAETTTTVERTSTTTTLTEASTATETVFSGVFEDAQGRRYGISVEFGGTATDESPGGCIGVAPPGKTNVVFVVEIENLIGDRPAPSPPAIFGSNVQTDGTTLPNGGYFNGPSANNQDSVEAFPNEPARLQLCSLEASAISAGFTEIAAGDVLPVVVTVGPVDDGHISTVELGIRLFAAAGDYTDAFMTTDPGSGSWVEP